MTRPPAPWLPHLPRSWRPPVSSWARGQAAALSDTSCFLLEEGALPWVRGPGLRPSAPAGAPHRRREASRTLARQPSIHAPPLKSRRHCSSLCESQKLDLAGFPCPGETQRKYRAAALGLTIWDAWVWKKTGCYVSCLVIRRPGVPVVGRDPRAPVGTDSVRVSVAGSAFSCSMVSFPTWKLLTVVLGLLKLVSGYISGVS